MIELINNLGRWIAAPPSIDAGDLAVLRAAFDTVVATPAFLADAKAQRLQIDPAGGAVVQEKVTALLARKLELRVE